MPTSRTCAAVSFDEPASFTTPVSGGQMVQTTNTSRQAAQLSPTRRVCSDDDEYWGFRTQAPIEYPHVYEQTQQAIDTGLLDVNGRKIMRDPESRPIGFLTHMCVR